MNPQSNDLSSSKSIRFRSCWIPGEQILSSPTKKGFNLTAWVLPFVVVLAGIGGLYGVLKHWASHSKPNLEPVSSTPEDTVYLEQVEEELKTFDA